MRIDGSWTRLAALALLVTTGGLAGCGDDGNGGTDAMPPTDAGTDAAPDAGDAGDTSPPVIDDVTLTESPSSVLVWLLDVTTNEPATLTVDVAPTAGGDGWSLDTPVEPSTDHSFVIAGLRAETDYEVTVRATDAAGNMGTAVDAPFTTDALPAELPPVELLSSDPTKMAPGYTLFPVTRWPAGETGADDETGWLIMVDPEGAIVWYAILDHTLDDVQLRPNGNLIYVTHDAIVELDVTGAVQNRWVATALSEEPVPDGAIGVDVDVFHHEVEELPNGNLMALSAEMREIGTDTCPSYGETLNVVGDVVVELDPETGDVVQRISMFDSLDPCRRMDRDFDHPFWNATYGGITTHDWTHGNAAVYDESRGIVVTSLRHADWVVAFDYVPGEPSMSGDVAWILGDEGTEGDYDGHPAFMPTGTPFEWQYHQHAPMYTADGNLLIYDNGNLRPGTDFDPDDADGDADLPYSRAVEYSLDTSAADPADWTIEQTWEHTVDDGMGGLLYAPFVGDADELENGNVLVTHGGIVEPPSNAIASPDYKKSARLLEVTRDGSDEVVFDLQVRDEAETGYTGYHVYRAERITGFVR